MNLKEYKIIDYSVTLCTSCRRMASLLQRLFPLILAACILVSCAEAADKVKQDVILPCYFGAYDANNDGVINVDEFTDATQGYTKVQPNVIFDRIDINGDKKIAYAEFREAMPGLKKDQVYDHCKRRCSWCRWR